MKTFQKIRSLDNQKRFNEQLKEKDVDVITYEKGDSFVVTEKIDGANASVMNKDGVISCYSHHKELSPDNTLNGFYGFVQDRKELLSEIIPDGCVLFGEWLVPHKIKYPEDAYHKWYLFDLCYMNDEKDEYNGVFDTHETYLRFNYHYDLDSKGIKFVPIYKSRSTKAPETLEDFDRVREELSHHSLLGADEGKAEGIVVTDIDKYVPVDENTNGLLRFKCVNEAFKEVRRAKKPMGEGQKAALDWASKYITEPRINKKIFGLQEDGYITDELSFDWMRNGNAKDIAEKVVLDALEESEETPLALSKTNTSYDKNMKTVQKFANKLTNKTIALKVKGIA
jgi:RNA ligase.